MLIAFAGLTLLAIFLTVRFAFSVLDPVSDFVTDEAEAVFVFAGGHGTRLDSGIALAERTAGLLVLNQAVSDSKRNAQRTESLCADELQTVRVECVAAPEETTHGEAIAFAALARERDFKDVAIVSNGYHLARAHKWFARCFDGSISLHDARERDVWRRKLIHEVLGLWQAMLFPARCDVTRP